MPALRRAAALAVVGLLTLSTVTACSNSESSVNRRPVSGSATASVVNGVQQVTILTGDDYRFHPSTITVHPGRVEIILKHTGTGAPHNWSLTGFPADFVPLTNHGQTRSATFVAPAPNAEGYQFTCTIHERQGQVGKLIVLRN